jgi:hypothetical protein
VTRDVVAFYVFLRFGYCDFGSFPLPHNRVKKYLSFDMRIKQTAPFLLSNNQKTHEGIAQQEDKLCNSHNLNESQKTN